MFCSISKQLLFLISNDLTILPGDADDCLEQQSWFKNKLSLTYIDKVNLGVLRLCYIELTNNESLPESSFLERSTDTQITTSRGFPAELWNIPRTFLRIHYRRVMFHMAAGRSFVWSFDEITWHCYHTSIVQLQKRIHSKTWLASLPLRNRDKWLVR